MTATGGLLTQSQVPLGSPPAAPGTGKGRWFPGDDDLPHFQKSDGTVLDLEYVGESGSFASIALTGTAGNGWLQELAQSVNPAAPSATGMRVFSGSTGAMSWVRKNGSDTYVRSFDTTLTADRTWTVFDASDTLVGLVQPQTLTKKTLNGPWMLSVTSTVTAATTTTLIVSSTPVQRFTGTTTQICALPDATTLTNGHQFYLFNRSTGIVTVNDGSGALLATLGGGQEVRLTLMSNGSIAGTWDQASVTGTGSYVLATSPTLTSPTANNLTLNGTLGTGYMQLGSWSTTNRPGSPANGMVGYNTTLTRIDFYSNGAWNNHVRLGGDTMTGALTIAGSADAAQFILKANSTQTQDMAQMYDTDGTTLRFQVSNTFNTNITSSDTSIGRFAATNSGGAATLFIRNLGTANVASTAQFTFQLPSDTTSNRTAAQFNAGFSTITDASRTATFQIFIANNATLNTPWLSVVGATATFNGAATFVPSDAVTNAVTNTMIIGHNSSGTPAANYGTGIEIQGKDSTTSSTAMADIYTIWTTATHASRKARLVLAPYDTAVRIALQLEASGSAAMIGVLGTAPIIQITTGVAAATFVANTSLIANDSATWGGYTIGQIVQALKNYGWLA